jgi:hypothetical protein
MSEPLSSIHALAEAAVDVVRDALGRVEEAAQRDDDAKWMDLSRRFAVIVTPLRDYLNGVQRGRDLPQTLAQRLDPLLDALDQVGDATLEIGVADHVAALRLLAHEARSSSSR